MERAFSFEVPLDPDEAAAVLHEAVHFRWGQMPQTVLRGKVRGRDFKLSYAKMVWSNTAKPVLRGTLRRSRLGTEVSGELDRCHEYKLMLATVILLAAVGLADALLGDGEEALFLIGMAALLWGLVYPMDRWLYRRYAARALDGLKAIFAEASAPPTAAP